MPITYKLKAKIDLTHMKCDFLFYDFVILSHVLHVTLNREWDLQQAYMQQFQIGALDEGEKGGGTAAAWPPGKNSTVISSPTAPFDLPNLPFKEESIQSCHTDTS